MVPAWARWVTSRLTVEDRPRWRWCVAHWPWCTKKRFNDMLRRERYRASRHREEMERVRADAVALTDLLAKVRVTVRRESYPNDLFEVRTYIDPQVVWSMTRGDMRDLDLMFKYLGEDIAYKAIGELKTMNFLKRPAPEVDQGLGLRVAPPDWFDPNARPM